MTVRDLLLDRASDYGIRAAHESEIAETGDPEAREAAFAFTLVELVLREIADAVGEPS